MATAGKKENDSAKALTERVRLLSRELEVEAALEKVRSRAMAMRSSDKLAEISAVMFRQIQVLGIDATRCGVGIFDDDHDAMEVWLTTAAAGEKVMRVLDYVNLHIHPVYENILAARKKKKPYAITVLKGEEVKHYYDTLAAYMAGAGHKALNKEEAFQSFFFEQGAINITTKKPLSEEERAIMVRFAKVFGLIYLRFVDLQKAERQANEARVEASLERVRGRSLAMRTSSELSETAVMLYKELRSLGVSNFFNCGFVEVDLETGIQHGWMTRPGGKQIEGFQLPLTGDAVLQERFEAWQRKDPVFYQSVGGAELKRHLDFVGPNLNSREVDKEITRKLPDPTVFYAFNFSHGYLHIIADSLLNADEEELAARFARVFQIAYRRFLDLKVAEAQAREARIEAALERIRARAMAMHSSSELMDVADVLREQMAQLGQPELETSALHFYNEVPDHIVSWRAFRLGTKTKGKISKGRMLIPNDACGLVKEWLRKFQSGAAEYTVDVSGNKQAEWYKILFRLAPEVGEAMVKRGTTAEPRYYHFSTFSGGALLMVAIKRPSDESIYLQRRAAAVFDLAYRRFLDLKQAEALEREARIELALERVRASTMAMQQSEELQKVILVVMDQFQHLGIPTDLANFNFYTKTKDWSMWLARPGFAYPAKIQLPYIKHPLFDGPLKGTFHKGSVYTDVLSQKEGVTAMKHIVAHPTLRGDQELRAKMKGAKGLARTISFGSRIMLTISRFDAVPYTAEQNAILVRFTKVFEQAYTRFLDLQKAEAQAREAQIEAALERVRAKTMAMHKSEQLPETAQVLFEQFAALGELPDRIGIGIFNEQLHVVEWWVTDQMGSQVTHKFNATLLEPTHAKAYAAWKLGKDSLVIELTGKALKEWIRFVKFEVKMPIDESNIKDRRVHHMAFFSAGVLLISAHEALPEATLQLLVRFATVFSQTYTRFLDLQKAEAQAREATIEAALERVRAKAMAMHNSHDLAEAAGTVLSELKNLGINPRRFAVGLVDKASRSVQSYSFLSSVAGDTLGLTGSIVLSGNPILEKVYASWESGEDFFTELHGEMYRTYYEAIAPALSLPPISQAQLEQKNYGTFICVPVGYVVAWTEEPIDVADVKIVKRFASIIDLTFRRYRELQNSEAIAKAAVQQASLDRVRAEIASMRHADDLQRITPLMWRELRTLGVPFFRCGVLIINEDKQKLDYYLSTPEGHPLAALHLHFNTPIETVQNALHHWRQQKEYITHWSKEQFVAFARSMMELGQIQTMKSYQGGDKPPESITLQFIPFAQGMLYVGSGEALSPDQINLVHALADAFSTAYTRYEDFTRLEAAKTQVEKTLSDLRVTQNQLVQSEKMASLGELTAGIAHEIQNPLNFVNNFSEVSKELLDEMKEELEKGNADDARQIAADVIQNLEKITFHGKRADGIVKSMLQHSRKSTGQKESTDINALCDEYLRLAYHGLRAKDKSFNAKFETNLDPAVGSLNVLPQEIGRVVLNLINNAFYAVSEKQKANSQNPVSTYEPTVTLTTTRSDTSVTIAVADNGNGIPASIKDKIFQPFFTTKPTGQGTGLGLSLSYDIITKGHDGRIEVETKENQGTTFTINLPSL